jgi:hypothetical protein
MHYWNTTVRYPFSLGIIPQSRLTIVMKALRTGRPRRPSCEKCCSSHEAQQESDFFLRYAVYFYRFCLKYMRVPFFCLMRSVIALQQAEEPCASIPALSTGIFISRASEAPWRSGFGQQGKGSGSRYRPGDVLCGSQRSYRISKRG